MPLYLPRWPFPWHLPEACSVSPHPESHPVPFSQVCSESWHTGMHLERRNGPLLWPLHTAACCPLTDPVCICLLLATWKIQGRARLIAPSRRSRQELFSLDVWLSGPWGWQAMMSGCHVSSRGGLGGERHHPTTCHRPHPSSHREV